MKTLEIVAAALVLGGISMAQETKKPERKPSDHALGYDDTPYLPGSRWRVHDKDRPRPPVVTPAPAAPAVPPPSDAVVLFDGKDLSQWKGGKGAAQWALADGAMRANRSGDIETVQSFGDCQLHIEWATPEVAKGESQERGNSGVFLMGRYEIQVLDSYENETYADGQAAAVYGQTPPLVNVCRPPGEWQTYDIAFTAPRFEGDKLVTPAFVTVLHNGVLVQDHTEILGATEHRRLAHYTSHGPGPLRLQDHGNPIRYRNIWIRPLAKQTPEPKDAGARGK